MPDSISGNRPTGTDYSDYQGDPLAEIKAKMVARGKGLAADGGSTEAGRVAKGGTGTGGDAYILDTPTTQPSAQQYQDTAAAMSRFTAADTDAVNLFQCMAVLYQTQQEVRKIDQEVATAETDLQVSKIQDEASQLSKQGGAALGGAIAFGVMDFASAGMSLYGGISAAGEEGSEMGELDATLQDSTGDESPMSDEQGIQLTDMSAKGGSDDLDVDEDMDDIDNMDNDDDEDMDDEDIKAKKNKKEEQVDKEMEVVGKSSDDSGGDDSDKSTKSKPERTSLEMRQKLRLNKWQSMAEVSKDLGNISKGLADFASTGYQANQKEDEAAAAEAQSDHGRYYDDAQNALSNMRDVQNMLQQIASTMHSWPSGRV